MNVATRWRVYPQLGRVSNLPTIATQAAAAVVIVDAPAGVVDVSLVGLGLASAYVAGMFLNDAFDRAIDARQRPDRPIPAGLVGAREVFGAGAGLLVVGVALLALAGVRHGHALAGLGGALALATAIVTYDVWHKGNPVAPLLMGTCRALVYVAAALSLTGRVPALVAVAGGAMLLYVAGLSEVARSSRAPLRGIVALAAAPIGLAVGCARSAAAVLLAAALGVVVAVAVQRSRAGQGERATVLLLGGLSLVDATLLASQGSWVLAAIAIVAMPLTRALQTVVRGT